MVFAGGDSNVPDGWLLCDGREVSRSDFEFLFAADEGGGVP
jgi:microcystin-dependent protein